ncbi:DUF4870 domain-containing protein [Serinicoccus kebangsaanensis]|uniref:DUF4870 domain-containing protein n=1 Tax=Serinicoccus kebangsaanensis TaxID=2602069 RepID=UPI001EE188F3|nr:DUF4870 domain-containing protein [Serinicoccus kebangsaanensis]
MTQTPPPPTGGSWQDPQQTSGPQGHPQQGAPQGPPPGPQGYGQPAGFPGGQRGSAPQGDERTMMLLAHLSGPIAMLFSAGWLPFLGPLLIWLFYKDKSAAVRSASAGAFNFNLSLGIASIVLWISVIITLGIGFIWAIPGWIAIFVVQLWCHIKGALRAADGRVYDYPFQLRLLS